MTRRIANAHSRLAFGRRGVDLSSEVVLVEVWIGGHAILGIPFVKLSRMIAGVARFIAGCGKHDGSMSPIQRIEIHRHPAHFLTTASGLAWVNKVQLEGSMRFHFTSISGVRMQLRAIVESEVPAGQMGAPEHRRGSRRPTGARERDR